MLTIRPMTEALLPLYHQIDTRSLASERAIVRVSRAGLSLGYDRAPESVWVSGAALEEVPGIALLTHADCACFFAFDGDACAGEISLRAGHGDAAELLDVRVDAGRRRQGVGRELLRTAEVWARSRHIRRIRFTASDDNPVACQYAAGCGFRLCGMDTALLPPRSGREGFEPPCALFFYKPVPGDGDVSQERK